ncbi:olfactory receptor 6F1-like [Emys orbicularis]|uniref:olfactory receptor 6F1-like n=1 Tax=Emys orbicularis TaxID=82168 RepID=UPI0031FCA256
MDYVPGTFMANQTRVHEFILLGFPGSQYLQTFLFVMFSMMGNMAIIILVRTCCHLQTPMNFFLCNLSFLEIWYTTACVPKTLAIFLGTSRIISFTGCITQMYFILSFGCTECFLLSVMAYDRYLAICYPLRYSFIMNSTLSAWMALCCWVSGFLAICVPAYLITRLSFCSPNVINHFYCDLDSWIVLSCTDKHLLQLVAFITSFIVLLGTCIITLISYIYIISTILRIPSAQGRQKAFSTCSAHLTLVIIWYGSTIFLYVKPSVQNTLDQNKIVNTLNTIVILLLNSFIYTLRNKEVKKALEKALTGM